MTAAKSTSPRRINIYAAPHHLDGDNIVNEYSSSI
jgi:hypothetical protein